MEDRCNQFYELMKKKRKIFRAWLLRLLYSKRLLKMEFATEPGLFYNIVFPNKAGEENYIYLGKNSLLLRKKKKDLVIFWMISL